MSTLITGAAGFLGSHLTERLLASGGEVVGLDSFDDFYAREIKEANLEDARRAGGFTLVEADIRDRAALDALPESIDEVVHLAARAGVRPSIEQPELYASVNVGGTYTLLEWAKRRGIRRFVFASSSSVYGNSPEVPFREDGFVGEPISPYAATKRACEVACHAYHHLHGMSILALRFFTVYGPRQRPDLAIHKFARLMTEGRPIPVFGDGTTARDYTYIDDIVQGIVGAVELAARVEEPIYEIVNLGESRTVTLAEMIEVVAAAMGVRPQLDRRPLQPGDVTRTFADIGKARRLLAYDPEWSFEDGVGAFAEWFRAHTG
jgi:UDP-glucuronate 4-epimerase